MRLSDWLKETGKTASELAREVGVYPSTISRLSNGERDASADLAREIHKATGGKVTANDLLGMRAA